MDAFAHGLDVAHALLTRSPLEGWRKDRYASFDAGAGSDFERGKLTLAALRELAAQAGEPTQRSGRQEAYENLVNQYLIR
jgi:xylose isomerase